MIVGLRISILGRIFDMVVIDMRADQETRITMIAHVRRRPGTIPSINRHEDRWLSRRTAPATSLLRIKVRNRDIAGDLILRLQTWSKNLCGELKIAYRVKNKETKRVTPQARNRSDIFLDNVRYFPYWKLTANGYPDCYSTLHLQHIA